MKSPTPKNELLTTIHSEYQALLWMVNRFSSEEQQLPDVNGGWAIKDILAHLSAWELLFLGWYQAGMNGETVVTPAPGFTWCWKKFK